MSLIDRLLVTIGIAIVVFMLMGSTIAYLLRGKDATGGGRHLR